MRKDGIQTRKRKPKKSGGSGGEMGKKDDIDGKFSTYTTITLAKFNFTT